MSITHTDHSFNLDQEALDYFGKVDASINHWSKELGIATIRLRGLEAQLAGLYDSQQQFIRKAIEKAGFPADKFIGKIEVVPPGVVKFSIVSDLESETPTANP
jgi:hypothetical protein